MEMTPAAQLLRDFDLRFVDRQWPFADERRDEIAALWAEMAAAHPSIFDGEILLALHARLENGILRGEIIRVRFSAYLLWRHLDRPEAGVTQVVAAAMVRGSDGGLIYGVQQASGLEPSAIKPPGGLLDPRDVRPDGQVDVFGTMARELEEETGLHMGDGASAETFVLSHGAMMIAIRVVDFPVPAGRLVEQIRATLRRQNEPELADVMAVRAVDDLDPARTAPRWLDAARHVLNGSL